MQIKQLVGKCFLRISRNIIIYKALGFEIFDDVIDNNLLNFEKMITKDGKHIINRMKYNIKAG